MAEFAQTLIWIKARRRPCPFHSDAAPTFRVCARAGARTAQHLAAPVKTPLPPGCHGQSRILSAPWPLRRKRPRQRHGRSVTQAAKEKCPEGYPQPGNARFALDGSRILEFCHGFRPHGIAVSAHPCPCRPPDPGPHPGARPTAPGAVAARPIRAQPSVSRSASVRSSTVRVDTKSPPVASARHFATVSPPV